MKEKIRKIIKPTKEEKFNKYLQDFRKNNIPERFNQIKMMDFLLDEEVDHYVSISNRSDGKSFNYLHFIIQLCIDKNIGFIYIARRFTVRDAGQKMIQKILDVFNFDEYDFSFMTGQKYTQLLYKNRTLAIITDLNEATDLKNESNFLMDFPILFYDEFLALESDYLMDEWERLKTIYSSVDRGVNPVPFIKIPKVIYLGNAVNFSSPILAHLDLYNILETHEINTCKKYRNIVLELNRNDNANESRNLRAFDEETDPLTMAQFKVNKHNISSEDERNHIMKDPSYIFIKLIDKYLKIVYNKTSFKNMLSVVAYAEKYDYNILLKDNNKDSTYLDENFYEEDYARHYLKNRHLFDNNYSKDYVLFFSNELSDLRINKIIKHHYVKNKNTKGGKDKEEIYNLSYIESTKKTLYRKFFNE